MPNMPTGQTGQLQTESREELLDYLMRRFGKEVIKLAYYHLRDRHLAEDVAQEAFCRVYKGLGAFRKESSYYTWIYKITVNLCRDVKKSAYYRKVLPWNYGMEQLDEARLFEEAEGGEVFGRVMDLPEKYRVVVALFYFEDLPTPDIAQILHIGENAVRTRLHRGRNMLKQSLGGLSYE